MNISNTDRMSRRILSHYPHKPLAGLNFTRECLLPGWADFGQLCKPQMSIIPDLFSEPFLFWLDTRLFPG